MSADRAAQLVEAGIWLKLSGDREGARKLFERALKLDPGNEKAGQLLAGGPAPGEVEQPPPASPIAPPPTIPSAVGANPFERQDNAAPSASESDWGLAMKNNVTPEPTLDGDWGRFTGAKTPVPQQGPAPVPTSDPGPYLGSPMNVVLGASPVPAAPKTTMQLFTPSAEAAPKTTLQLFTPAAAEAPAPKTTQQLFTPSASDGPAPKTTMQFFKPEPAAPESTEVPQHQLFTPEGELREGPARHSTQQLFAPQKHATQQFGEPKKQPTQQLFTEQGELRDGPVRHSTQQLFSPAPAADPKTIQIGGEPGPEAPPPSTPPLFGYSSDSSLGLAPTGASLQPPQGVAVTQSPKPSTPLFASMPVDPAAAARTTTEPMGYAWAWSSSPPPKPVDPEAEAPPVPRPSPSLAPKAESAWDHRSNPGIKLEAVVGKDRALDLISSDSKLTRSPESHKEEIRAILRGARDLLDLDDHTGAMELIVKAQEIAPDDPDVIAMKERSEKTLLNMFESKLGKIETIPRVLLKDDEIIWLNLDHRAGFVLAQIDGTVSFDDLFSVSGMSRIDTARILAQLVEEGVISRG